MKTTSVFLALLVLLSTGCTDKSETTVAPKPTYDETSIALMAEVAPLVSGNWTLEAVHFKRRVGFSSTSTVPRDSVLRQFATLALVPAAPRSSAPDPRYPEFDGNLTFRGKNFPVHFRLMASPGYVVEQTGPQAYFLLDYNFPPGSHPTSPEEQFLQELGFMGDNYSLTVTKGAPTMVWQGLNRTIERVELRK
jgi:hypothetical protein